MRADKSKVRLFLALTAAATLMLGACGGGDTAEPDQDIGAAETDPGEASPAGDFTLVSEGHLTVGSDIPYPPFEFEEDGELTGFDVELIQAVAEKIGVESTAEDWISTDFNTIFQQLAAGNRFDIVVAAVTGYAPEGSPASETVAERREVVDFSVAYYDSLQSLAVDTSRNPDITGVDALPDGARVAVQRATTGAFYAQENLTGAELVEFPKAPPMYQALQAGQVDAVFNDLPVSLEAIKDTPNLEVVEQVDTGEQYGIAVSKENAALTEAIDAALNELFADGTYAEIFTKYFPDQELPEYASE